MISNLFHPHIDRVVSSDRLEDSVYRLSRVKPSVLYIQYEPVVLTIDPYSTYYGVVRSFFLGNSQVYRGEDIHIFYIKFFLLVVLEVLFLEQLGFRGNSNTHLFPFPYIQVTDSSKSFSFRFYFFGTPSFGPYAIPFCI